MTGVVSYTLQTNTQALTAVGDNLKQQLPDQQGLDIFGWPQPLASGTEYFSCSSLPGITVGLTDLGYEDESRCHHEIVSVMLGAIDIGEKASVQV